MQSKSSSIRHSSYKKKAIEERLHTIENDLAKACEYLESGAHANWHKFRPLFVNKVKDGKLAPPHKDWVKNVFIPYCEKAIRDQEAKLERFG